jgi:hypothetical protein
LCEKQLCRVKEAAEIARLINDFFDDHKPTLKLVKMQLKDALINRSVMATLNLFLRFSMMRNFNQKVAF